MTTIQDTLTLPIFGLTDDASATTVEEALRAVPGVKSVHVDIVSGKAALEVSQNRPPTPGDLNAAVEEAGHHVLMEKISLNIGGMTCASCVIHVENALYEVPGVLSASVNLATDQATVQYLPGMATLDDISHMVADAGYSIDGLAGDEADEEAATERLARTKEINALARKVIIAGMVGAAVMTIMFIPLETLHLSTFQLNFILWTLATPVQFWIGATFYRAAWGALKHRTTNMDTLVAVGTSVA